MARQKTLLTHVKVGVPKEVKPGERRVALVPEAAKKLADRGFAVVVERGAGDHANLTDADYEKAGAQLGAATDAWAAEAVLKVAAPEPSESPRPGSVLIGFLSPLTNTELVKRLAEARVTSFAMEAIPRTTRAQSMDALSSQAVVAGYRATLAGAQALGKFFPMLTTAAGTVKPARVLVLGAGVAGLQAIATAKRLGAVVEAYDVRPAVKEEVQSLGAKFVQIEVHQEGDGSGSGEYAKEVSADVQRRQQELLAERVAAADVVITTAAVPGRPAPMLVSAEMVRAMRPGSVVVDLAAETGGNCELTAPGTVAVRDGVTIDATLNLPSQMPFHSSLLYANNVVNLLTHLAPEGELALDFEDEITAGAAVTHDGRIVNERVEQAVGLQANRPVSEGTHSA
ncbi:MAG: Re/Si-specific NAD(P)(+) transhydrogenase subunit alpha [Solirubrobacterales bacterium]